VPFEYFDVLKDAQAMTRMIEFSKGGRVVPVIVEKDQVYLGYGGGS